MKRYLQGLRDFFDFIIGNEKAIEERHRRKPLGRIPTPEELDYIL